MLGLVLTAGGARGAYQAGVLKRIGEMPVFDGQPSPFAIVAGASAGAINGSLLAAQRRALRATRRASSRASGRSCASSTCSAPTSGRSRAAARRSARDFVLGGLVGRTFTQRALRHFAARGAARATCSRRAASPKAIRHGHLYAVAVAATSYHSGRSFTFIQGRRGPSGVDEEPARRAAGDAHAPSHPRVARDPDRVPAGARRVAGGRALVRRRRSAPGRRR